MPMIFYDPSSLQFPTWYAHTYVHIYMKMCWRSNDHSRYTFTFMTTVIKQKNIDDLSLVQMVFKREKATVVSRRAIHFVQ
jgi:hypothetical protein